MNYFRFRHLAGIAMVGALVMVGSACSSRNSSEVAHAQAAPVAGRSAPPPYNRPSYAQLAPEFPTGAAWFNVSHPLTMQSLRGKMVLLDFWTYG